MPRSLTIYLHPYPSLGLVESPEHPYVIEQF